MNYSLTTLGNEAGGYDWGYWADPDNTGIQFITRDAYGNAFTGPGYVDWQGRLVSPPAPAASGGGGGSAAADSGASAGSSGSAFDPNRLRRDRRGQGPTTRPFWETQQDAGLWENVGDLDNSPLWQQYFDQISANGGNPDAVREVFRNDPTKMQETLIGFAGNAGGMTPIDMEQAQALAAGGYDPSQLEGLQAARIQSAQDMDWDDYGDMLMEMGLNIAAGSMLGMGFGGLGASLGAGFGSSGAGAAAGKMLPGMVMSGDPIEAIKGYAIGQGVGGAAGQIAPYVGSAMDSLGLTGMLEQVKNTMTPEELSQAMEGGAEAAGDGMFSGPSAGQANARFNAAFGGGAPSSGASFIKTSGEPLYSTVGADGGEAMTTLSTGEVMPAGTALETYFPEAAALASTSTLDAEDAANREELESGDNLQQQSEADLAAQQTAARNAQIAKVLEPVIKQLLPQSADAPQREEGQTDEQYQQELVEYMNLDAAAMAEQGLTPGTPEYMEFILSQADAVIAQVMEGVDVDAEDLADQLRTKTEAELAQLQRALYVRGQLDLMMGSGTYTDPFTGTAEEVITPEGMLADPNTAAYQRGLARSTDTLAGLRGDEAASYLNELLGRKSDLFGMQQAQDDAFERAKLEENDEMRKRRGMLS